jgi:hypothetical protein
LTLPPDVRVAQRNVFRNQSSTIRGENDDNDHGVSVETFTEQSRIQEYIFALVQSNIHDSLVKLMEQDIPTNYEEAMVDLSTRNDYESWNPILSYI